MSLASSQGNLAHAFDPLVPIPQAHQERDNEGHVFLGVEPIYASEFRSTLHAALYIICFISHLRKGLVCGHHQAPFPLVLSSGSHFAPSLWNILFEALVDSHLHNILLLSLIL